MHSFEHICRLHGRWASHVLLSIFLHLPPLQITRVGWPARERAAQPGSSQACSQGWRSSVSATGAARCTALCLPAAWRRPQGQASLGAGIKDSQVAAARKGGRGRCMLLERKVGDKVAEWWLETWERDPPNCCIRSLLTRGLF